MPVNITLGKVGIRNDGKPSSYGTDKYSSGSLISPIGGWSAIYNSNEAYLKNNLEMLEVNTIKDSNFNLSPADWTSANPTNLIWKKGIIPTSGVNTFRTGPIAGETSYPTGMQVSGDFTGDASLKSTINNVFSGCHISTTLMVKTINPISKVFVQCGAGERMEKSIGVTNEWTKLTFITSKMLKTTGDLSMMVGIKGEGIVPKTLISNVEVRIIGSPLFSTDSTNKWKSLSHFNTELAHRALYKMTYTTYRQQRFDRCFTTNLALVSESVNTNLIMSGKFSGQIGELDINVIPNSGRWSSVPTIKDVYAANKASIEYEVNGDDSSDKVLKIASDNGQYTKAATGYFEVTGNGETKSITVTGKVKAPKGTLLNLDTKTGILAEDREFQYNIDASLPNRITDPYFLDKGEFNFITEPKTPGWRSGGTGGPIKRIELLSNDIFHYAFHGVSLGASEHFIAWDSIPCDRGDIITASGFFKTPKKGGIVTVQHGQGNASTPNKVTFVRENFVSTEADVWQPFTYEKVADADNAITGMYVGLTNGVAGEFWFADLAYTVTPVKNGSSLIKPIPITSDNTWQNFTTTFEVKTPDIVTLGFNTNSSVPVLVKDISAEFRRSALTEHINNDNHDLTAAQVGLDKVLNTSDLNKTVITSAMKTYTEPKLTALYRSKEYRFKPVELWGGTASKIDDVLNLKLPINGLNRIVIQGTFPGGNEFREEFPAFKVGGYLQINTMNLVNATGATPEYSEIALHIVGISQLKVTSAGTSVVRKSGVVEGKVNMGTIKINYIYGLSGV